MQKRQELMQVLESNPDAHIYYSDNGSFMIFTNQEDFDKSQQMSGVKYDKFIDSITLFEGTDHGENNGYIPLLVEVLAQIQGYTSESV